jgi:hypothetical protein
LPDGPPGIEPLAVGGRTMPLALPNLRAVEAD